MLYLKDGILYTEHEVRNLDMTIPCGYPFTPLGYEPVIVLEQPAHTVLEEVVMGNVELNSAGLLQLVWIVQSKFQQYTDSNNVVITQEAQEAAFMSQYQLNLIQVAEASYKDLVQAYLDNAVRERGYDSIISICSYRDSTVPKFQQEALDAIAWRDTVWVFCGELLASVMTGTQTIPAPEEIIALLPPLIWTNP